MRRAILVTLFYTCILGLYPSQTLIYKKVQLRYPTTLTAGNALPGKPESHFRHKTLSANCLGLKFWGYSKQDLSKKASDFLGTPSYLRFCLMYNLPPVQFFQVPNYQIILSKIKIRVIIALSATEIEFIIGKLHAPWFDYFSKRS